MRWPPYQHVFFDCDSTLTTVEGIDILAEAAGKKWRVEVLTRAAMDGELALEEVYAKRLQAVHPTFEQINHIRHAYKRHIVEDAQAVVAALQHLGHEVYIISGGLAEPVEEFGVFLGVPRHHIRAVGVAYNQLSGDWWRGDKVVNPQEEYLTYEEGALTVSDGKAQIIKTLLEGKNGRSLLIGDGSSDLLAGQAVDLFVGFGGVVARNRVRQQAPIFLQSPGLSPLLPLAAGPAALRQLHHTPYASVFSKGLNLIQTGVITFNDDKLNIKFREALQATHQTFYPWAN